MDRTKRPTWWLFLPMIWPLVSLVAKIVGWMIEDDFRTVSTAGFWFDCAGSVVVVLLAGMALVGIGLVAWKFCVWFDAAIERERVKIARRAAIYHGEPSSIADHAMRDAELDG